VAVSAALSQTPVYTARPRITELAHHTVCLFTSPLLLVLTASTYVGMARLSRPGWLVTYWNDSPICWWSLI